jgi:hypothetical protein
LVEVEALFVGRIGGNPTIVEHRPVPGWTLASAIGAPVMLVVSAVAAQLMTKGTYDPMRQTISELAAGGRAEVIITCGFVVCAACQVVTAAGLRWMRAHARVVLGIAGCCGLALAALPVTQAMWTMAHVVAAGSGAVMLAVWPLFTISAEPVGPRVCRPRWAAIACALMSMLLIWALYETQQGAMLGLAERIAIFTELTWPAIVVFAVRRWSCGTSAANGPRLPQRPERMTSLTWSMGSILAQLVWHRHPERVGRASLPLDRPYHRGGRHAVRNVRNRVAEPVNRRPGAGSAHA